MKNHLDAPLSYGEIVNRDSPDINGPAVGSLQAGNEPQGSGLATTAFADDHQKLALLNLEVRLIYCDYRTEPFGEMA